MCKFPEHLVSEWQQRSGPAVLSTVSADGVPNVIYTAFIRRQGDEAFLITDHFFNKTRENILNGSKGAILFLSEDGKTSYQVKGSFEYHDEGDVLDNIRTKMPPNLPSRAAVVFNIESVYSGGEQLS